MEQWLYGSWVRIQWLPVCEDGRLQLWGLGAGDSKWEEKPRSPAWWSSGRPAELRKFLNQRRWLEPKTPGGSPLNILIDSYFSIASWELRSVEEIPVPQSKSAIWTHHPYSWMISVDNLRNSYFPLAPGNWGDLEDSLVPQSKPMMQTQIADRSLP